MYVSTCVCMHMCVYVHTTVQVTHNPPHPHPTPQPPSPPTRKQVTPPGSGWSWSSADDGQPATGGSHGSQTGRGSGGAPQSGTGARESRGSVTMGRGHPGNVSGVTALSPPESPVSVGKKERKKNQICGDKQDPEPFLIPCFWSPFHSQVAV